MDSRRQRGHSSRRGAKQQVLEAVATQAGRAGAQLDSTGRKQANRALLWNAVGGKTPYPNSGLNWIGDKARLSATENFGTLLSSLEMRCELSLVLSWPSFQFATWLPIVTYLETGSRLVHKCVHTADKTKLFSLQYIENCLQLLQTQFTPLTRWDETLL